MKEDTDLVCIQEKNLKANNRFTMRDTRHDREEHTGGAMILICSQIAARTIEQQVHENTVLVRLDIIIQVKQ